MTSTPSVANGRSAFARRRFRLLLQSLPTAPQSVGLSAAQARDQGVQAACRASAATGGEPAAILPNVHKTAPKTIYLVIGEDMPPEEDFSRLERSIDTITWCEDQIDENSIPYVRADLAPPSDAGQRALLDVRVYLPSVDLAIDALDRDPPTGSEWPVNWPIVVHGLKQLRAAISESEGSSNG